MSKRGQNEGSIHKRKDGRWAGVLNLGYVNGKRKRKYFYGDTQKEVKDQLTVALHEQQQGLPVAMERQTLEQFLAHWIEESARPHIAPKTYFSYKQMIRLYLVPDLGRIQLTKLTPYHIQSFINHMLEQELSPRTIQYCHAILRRALTLAMRWGLVSRNVATLVELPRQKRKEQDFLDPDEARQLLEAIRGDRLEALYTVALAIGLRKGEALGLRWKDIDFESHSVKVQTALQWIRGQQPALKDLKTDGSHRQLVIPAFAVETLLAHQEKQHREHELLGSDWKDMWGLVFTTSHGTPLSERNVTRSFHRMLKRAGMERMRFYDMRHTCASLLIAQGVHPRVVMEILGHSQIHLTMNRYGHVIAASHEEAAGLIDDLFKNQS